MPEPCRPPLFSLNVPAFSPQQFLCNRVATRVAAEFGLDAAEVMAPTRGAPSAAFARQVAMYLAHVAFALSFGAVGRAFGRDRTTVAYACRIVEDGRDNPGFDVRLTDLERSCRALHRVSVVACEPIRGNAQ